MQNNKFRKTGNCDIREYKCPNVLIHFLLIITTVLKTLKQYLFIIIVTIVGFCTLLSFGKAIIAVTIIRSCARINGTVNGLTNDTALAHRIKNHLDASFIFPDESQIIPIHIGNFNNRIGTGINADDDTAAVNYLWLGCSFTFGDNCVADSTYPFLVNAAMNKHSINAAMGGYGFAQMLLRAQELAPVLKPQIIFFQYSDWLIERSQSHINNSIKPLPFSAPYFYSDANGNILIQKPLFDNADVLALINTISTGPAGFFYRAKDVFSYQRVLIKKYVALAVIWFHQQTGEIPKPEMDNEKILAHALDEMKLLCAKNNCQLIVVGIGNQTLPVPAGVNYINAEQGLVDYQKQTGVAYNLLYHHWTKNRVEDFDHHPNNLAHSIFAKSILQKLKESNE